MVHPSASRLADSVRSALAAQADPSKAGPMQAYMKSEMPYRGVQTPVRRKLVRKIFAEQPLDSHGAWSQAVLELWRGARFREERYAAMDLAEFRLYRDHQTIASLPIYEEMIVDGAWWDFVDNVSARLLGAILERQTKPMTARMRRWSRVRNLWKRRASILCQLRRKEETDLHLLFHAIEGSIADDDFFARKAIGWALRQYGRVGADVVVRYVEENRGRLSLLSRREALKNLRDHPLFRDELIRG